jgi:hypothetical protein
LYDWTVSVPVADAILLLAAISKNSAFVFQKYTFRLSLVAVRPDGIEQFLTAIARDI